MSYTGVTRNLIKTLLQGVWDFTSELISVLFSTIKEYILTLICSYSSNVCRNSLDGGSVVFSD